MSVLATIKAKQWQLQEFWFSCLDFRLWSQHPVSIHKLFEIKVVQIFDHNTVCFFGPNNFEELNLVCPCHYLIGTWTFWYEVIKSNLQPFSPISGVCNLCTLEKYYILFKPGIGTLNKREELFNYCMHKKRLLLDKT